MPDLTQRNVSLKTEKKFLNKILFTFTSLKKSFSFHFLRFFPDVEEFRSQNSGQSRHELSGVN